jgi:hypothetical protein
MGSPWARAEGASEQAARTENAIRVVFMMAFQLRRFDAAVVSSG